MFLKPLLTANWLLSMGMISAQKFANGGIVQGRKHSQGGVIIEAEGGEAIFSAKATKGNERVLANMNKSMSNGASLQQAISRVSPNTSEANAGLISGISNAIKNINIGVTLQGQFLRDVDFYKMSKNGEKQRVGI